MFTSFCIQHLEDQCRVSQLFVGLGWVDFDLGVPPSCPAAQPLLPNSHQPNQNRADGGTLKIQVDPTQSTSRWDTLCINSVSYLRLILGLLEVLRLVKVLHPVPLVLLPQSPVAHGPVEWHLLLEAAIKIWKSRIRGKFIIK